MSFPLLNSRYIPFVILILAGLTMFQLIWGENGISAFNRGQNRLSEQYRQNQLLGDRVDSLRKEIEELQGSKRQKEKALRNRSFVVGEKEEVIYFTSRPEDREK